MLVARFGQTRKVGFHGGFRALTCPIIRQSTVFGAAAIPFSKEKARLRFCVVENGGDLFVPTVLELPRICFPQRDK